MVGRLSSKKDNLALFAPSRIPPTGQTVESYRFLTRTLLWKTTLDNPYQLRYYQEG
jgi:hypothetical protein